MTLDNAPTLLFVAPAGFCVLSWVGVGSLVPRRALSGEALLDCLTRVGLGSVAVSLLLLVLGRVGLFDPALLDCVTTVAAFVGVRALWRARGAMPRVSLGSRLERILLGCVAVALTLDLVAATAPPTSADALKYHLALPKLWLQVGSVGDPFWRWEGFNPSAIEMLYAQGLAIGGGCAAATLHAFFAVGCAAAVFGLSRELGGRALAGSLAAFLFVLQGVVTWEATSAFIELGLTFYVVVAVWYAVRAVTRAGAVSATWTGFFAGAAAGTKYLGLLAAAIILAPVAAVSILRRASASALYTSLAALAAAGAWYLKNLVATGNPLYPVVFGGKWLTPYATAQIHASLADYGVGGGVLRLAILPIDLILHGDAFDRGQYVGTAIFLLAALGLVVRRRRAELPLALGVLAYLVAWQRESPQARFLLPALAVLASLGGLGAGDWVERGARRRLAVLAVLGCAAVAWLAASVALTRQLLPVTVGAESRQAYLERLTGTYDALLAARTRVGPGRIGVAGYDFVFDIPGQAVDLGVPEFVPSLSRAETLRRLTALRVSSILVGGGLGSAPQLAPVRGCLTETGAFAARFVTSRSLGRSIPFDFMTYSLARCQTHSLGSSVPVRPADPRPSGTTFEGGEDARSVRSG
jgi:hypothetical protein